MRNRDPRKKKERDLRHIARRGGYNPSVFDLFYKYHPEVKEREKQLLEEYRTHKVFYWHSSDWQILHNLQYEWVVKIAGYWDILCGAPPSWYRRMHNRLDRARQKSALCRSIQNDDLENFNIPRRRRDIRWSWF